jgi:hypothetical protein
MFKVGDKVRHHRCTDEECPSIGAEFEVDNVYDDGYVYSKREGVFSPDEIELVESSDSDDVTP